jgi:hypothetical protein
MVLELWRYADKSGWYVCRFFGGERRQVLKTFGTKRGARRRFPQALDMGIEDAYIRPIDSDDVR